MSVSVAEALRLTGWLAQRLAGAGLQDVRQPQADTLVLSFRQPGETVHLLLAIGAGRSRLHTLARPPQNPSRAHAFQGLLRKELAGSIEGLEAVGNDRIVALRMANREGTRRTLVAELSDRHGNFFLLDEHGMILGAARPPRSTSRALHSGARWSPPPIAGGSESDRFATVSGEQLDAAVRAHYQESDEQRRIEGLQQRLRKVLSGRRRQLRRTARKQALEAARGEHAAPLRREAELLQGAFHLLEKGMSELEVDDYYSEPATRVRVQLDPALSPGQQVEKRYARARRAERSGQQAQRRLALTNAELSEVEGLLAQLEAADSAAALEALEAALPVDLRRRLAEKPRGLGSRRRASQSPRLPYISYRTAGGIELRVGRGARENDDLTFRLSRGNDVWLHVRGRPGAHVVICCPGPSPSPELLMLGAQVALAHSAIKEGAREEVCWTRVKAVRKPRGMPPGKVLVGQEKVLYVEARRSALDALVRC
jgi:predicted ribosome quality control (RQC) complex YloA/Tae2 family protein